MGPERVNSCSDGGKEIEGGVLDGAEGGPVGVGGSIDSGGGGGKKWTLWSAVMKGGGGGRVGEAEAAVEAKWASGLSEAMLPMMPGGTPGPGGLD